MKKTYRFPLAFSLLITSPLGAQQLVDPGAGVLELVTPDPAQQALLNSIDGLAFDGFGNLFGAREILGPEGGVVYVDKATGQVTPLATGLPRADQVALHPGGQFYVTLEVSPGSTSGRVLRLDVAYGAGQVPQASGTLATSLTTSLPINNPEGLVVLDAASAYGAVGDLYVCEDRNPGRILHVDPQTGAATVLASGLQRPEGMAFGDFSGALPPALYVAETSTNVVLRVDASGATSVFGNPAAVGLVNPDNVEFGPDGFLYVTEDRNGPNSRVIRIASDGTHSEFITGLDAAQGMIFDANGDLYIAEQFQDRIWRVRFGCPQTAATVASYNGTGINLDLLTADKVVVGSTWNATLAPQPTRASGGWVCLVRTAQASGPIVDLGTLLGLPPAGPSELLVGGATVADFSGPPHGGGGTLSTLSTPVPLNCALVDSIWTAQAVVFGDLPTGSGSFDPRFSSAATGLVGAF